MSECRVLPVPRRSAQRRRAARPAGGAIGFDSVFLVLLIVLISSVGGCSRRALTEDAATPELIRTKTEEQVTVTLRVSPSQPSALAPVRVRVAAEAPAGVALSPNDYAATLRSGICRFDCRVLRAAAPRGPALDGGILRWSQEVDVEFLLAGDFDLPGARVSVTDARAVGAAEPSDSAGGRPRVLNVETEPVRLHVAVPAGGDLSTDQLAAIKTLDPVELPTPWSKWWWMGPLAAIAVAAALALAAFVLGQVFPPFKRWLTRMRGRLARMVETPPPPPLPAHEWASREFARLLAENLPAAGRIREFYFRLSDIVRGYIERRFEISAPEMTTEEFLAAATHDRRFEHRYTVELQRFLTACDLVKYAGFRPDPGEADELTRTAMDFVAHTRADAATAGQKRAPAMAAAAA